MNELKNIIDKLLDIHEDIREIRLDVIAEEISLVMDDGSVSGMREFEGETRDMLRQLFKMAFYQTAP